MKTSISKTVFITYTGLVTSLVISLLVIFGLILSGCVKENVVGSGRVITEQRPVNIFRDITMDGDFILHLKQGDDVPLKIEADDNLIRYIETYVSNQTLRIRVQPGIYFRRKSPIHIYLESRNYNSVVLSGSGDMYTDNTITNNAFSMDLNGSGSASLKMASLQVNASVNGSGNLRFEGDADRYRATVNGSGNIDGLGLNTRIANITINGSGNQRVSVKDEIDIKILGSGNVTYKGNPEIVKTQVTGSGKINKI
ncbi:putative autotransporter adhesin-like protein [Chitinophaga skermanii]|uniref:Putative autotransporter adhesin-like protein n=1 Tax=Chitinophaga skermanii TaxID=331697 RepID=A0A327R4D7_9BACT|nr:head GIN domain-containing protein [Chitinophaga skermanii]RAJ10593.1 putative autotransporter adhesin-like protein [Chitinophaga skermanii]